MENRLIPYVATTSFGLGRILVFAPHPDDEVFGCGGAILRQVSEGGAVQVVVLTDGDYQPNCADTQIYGQTRREESCKAAQALGYGAPVFWGLKDRGLEYGEQLVQRLMSQIKSFAADGVFAPSIYEMHPDHRALGMAAVEAVRRLGSTLKLVFYEVGVPIPRPNVLLDISAVAQSKQDAMSCFVSQLQGQAYDQQIRALNCFRTYTLGTGVTAAEAYRLVETGELERESLELYESEHQRQQSLGLPMMPKDLPLVSVILRCEEVSGLQSALDSIALQTYPHVEVIVLREEGATPGVAQSTCGRFPMQEIQASSTLGCAAFVNSGMKLANGEYMIILETVDVFLPDHLDKLVRSLAKGKALATCTGVKFIDTYGELVGILDEPWDLEQLRREGIHPSNALMFARSLTESGCQFEGETRQLDYAGFWQQIAGHTAIRHVPGVSALCRSANSDFSRIAENERQQARIHEAQEGLVKVNLQLVASQTRAHDLEVQLGLLRSEMAQMTSAVALKTAEALSLKSTVEALVSSTSWRVTSPLRFLSRLFKGSL